MDILELLALKGIPYTLNGTSEVKIVCPNQSSHSDGLDSNPSCSINLDKEVCFCFSCGYKMGTIGLTKWLNGESLDETQMRTLKLRSSMKRLKAENQLTLVESKEQEILFPNGEKINEDYRNISIRTYNDLGAVKVSRGRYADRICFPIYVDGVLLGVDARTLLEGVQPKYLRNYGSSCKDDWLYPWDITKSMCKDFCIIAEGIFHAVNGVDKGFPTLAYFGSNNFSVSKVMKLLDLNVREIVYFKDNDLAGEKAEKAICEMLLEWFDVSIIPSHCIPAGKDLGDMTREEIQTALDNRVRFK